MRWTWRVPYYAFNALGTDRYPPFSLHSDPDYPADLADRLPAAALARAGAGEVVAAGHPALHGRRVVHRQLLSWSFGYGDDSGLTAGFGLIGILVIVARRDPRVHRRYPRPLFDFVMGMNRWCYRVLAYVALMRDEYPPFRLDNGGTDPGSVPQPPPPDRTDEPASAATPAV